MAEAKKKTLTPTDNGEPASVFMLEFTNDDTPPATLKVTLRARGDESEADMLIRTMQLVEKVEADSMLRGLKWRAHEFNRSGKKAPVAIKDDMFILTTVKRTETKKIDSKTNKPWSKLVAIGEQDGQKVQASDFLGSDSVGSQSATHRSGLFPNVMSWPADTEKPIAPLGRFIVKVKRNENPAYGYDIVDIVKAASVETEGQESSIPDPADEGPDPY